MSVKPIPSGFGFGDMWASFSLDDSATQEDWMMNVIKTEPNGYTAYYTIEDTRQFAANLIAACDAAEEYRDQLINDGILEWED